jgi:hypothetical protein
MRLLDLLEMVGVQERHVLVLVAVVAVGCQPASRQFLKAAGVPEAAVAAVRVTPEVQGTREARQIHPLSTVFL